MACFEYVSSELGQPMKPFGCFVYQLHISANYISEAGHAVAPWLRHCTTNRKVAGSIPDGVTGFFH
jgi:hypothetical protein